MRETARFPPSGEETTDQAPKSSGTRAPGSWQLPETERLQKEGSMEIRARNQPGGTVQSVKTGAVMAEIIVNVDGAPLAGCSPPRPGAGSPLAAVIALGHVCSAGFLAVAG